MEQDSFLKQQTRLTEMLRPYRELTRRQRLADFLNASAAWAAMTFELYELLQSRVQRDGSRRAAKRPEDALRRDDATHQVNARSLFQEDFTRLAQGAGVAITNDFAPATAAGIELK